MDEIELLMNGFRGMSDLLAHISNPVVFGDLSFKELEAIEVNMRRGAIAIRNVLASKGVTVDMPPSRLYERLKE